MDSGSAAAPPPKDSMLDPFLVEALQNPRHRLTILRMELDIQRFMQSPDQQRFEFQHFPTSYLRLAAHRVAQHYGLISMVQDNGLDGVGRIVVKKTGEIRCPAVRLSEIPTKQFEFDRPEQVKIAIRPRPQKGSGNDANEFGAKTNSFRSVEERKEDYDKARARIFSTPGSPTSDDSSSQSSPEGKIVCLSRDETELFRSSIADQERNICSRDINASRVAIFRDREKDRTDPDYDRSYERYIRSLPTQSYGSGPFNMLKVQQPFVQYDSMFGQMQMLRTQASLNYRHPANAVASSFSAMGLDQTSGEGAYMQWPSSTMMYAHSYDQFRHGVFQAPFCHQPLSFDYSLNH